MPDDPLQHRAFADAIVARAASQLRELLTRVARDVRPFPAFPGGMFVYGLEVEPPPGSPHGCVIVMDDGELYELHVGLDEDAVARGGDHVATRHEVTVKLELAPDAYISFAQRAVAALVDHLEDRAGGAR